MYLQQLKETSGVEITHWFENTFFISNNVTKRGIIDVGDGGKPYILPMHIFDMATRIYQACIFIDFARPLDEIN